MGFETFFLTVYSNYRNTNFKPNSIFFPFDVMPPLYVGSENAVHPPFYGVGHVGCAVRFGNGKLRAEPKIVFAIYPVMENYQKIVALGAYDKICKNWFNSPLRRLDMHAQPNDNKFSSLFHTSAVNIVNYLKKYRIDKNTYASLIDKWENAVNLRKYGTTEPTMITKHTKNAAKLPPVVLGKILIKYFIHNKNSFTLDRHRNSNMFTYCTHDEYLRILNYINNKYNRQQFLNSLEHEGPKALNLLNVAIKLFVTYENTIQHWQNKLLKSVMTIMGETLVQGREINITDPDISLLLHFIHTTRLSKPSLETLNAVKEMLKLNSNRYSTRKTNKYVANFLNHVLYSIHNN